MKAQTRCRVCGSQALRLFLDLGEMPLANSFLRKEELGKDELRFPLRVLFCEDCNLCQLGQIVDRKILFKNYIYFSSAMPKLSDYFKHYVDQIYERFITSKDDLIVEIGSNDGLLLSAIQEYGTRVLGIDPAKNIASIANQRGVPTISDFFSNNLAQKIVKKYGNARVVIGNNVVAHIDNHHDLLEGIKTLLEKDGIFVLEAPYLSDMFVNRSFDTVYHEHLSYLAVRPLMRLASQHGMEIFDVQTHPVQGLSLRVFIGNQSKQDVSTSVLESIRKELTMGLNAYKTYIKLAKEISLMKKEVQTLLRQLKREGNRIAAYGAPAKGNTLLNYFEIGPSVLDYATEELPSKIGLYTPGMHIPVVDINEARKNPPDYFLLLAWNYKDAIWEKEKVYRQNGGKFIVPIGKIEII